MALIRGPVGVRYLRQCAKYANRIAPLSNNQGHEAWATIVALKFSFHMPARKMCCTIGRKRCMTGAEKHQIKKGNFLLIMCPSKILATTRWMFTPMAEDCWKRNFVLCLFDLGGAYLDSAMHPD